MPKRKQQKTESKAGEDKISKKAKSNKSNSAAEVTTEPKDEVSKQSKHDKSESSTTSATAAVAKVKGPSNLKVISWNISGVRAWIKKDGLSIFDEDPDILCLQEIKCPEKKFPVEFNKYKTKYFSYIFSGAKDGYSGVALFSKVKPLSVKKGIENSKHDDEGRCITAEYENFYLVTSYVPNAGRGLVTLDKRMDWDTNLQKYLKDLDAKKPIIYCGDLNVSHKEIDLANPKGNKRTAGFTQEERDGFTNLLNEGFVDSFRELYPDMKDQYTFWAYMGNARAKNIGWRLDYFVLSKNLVPNLRDNIIQKSVMGSDHCPIVLQMQLDKK